MFIILGGTGHVGSAAASALLDQGENVTIVTHAAAKAEHWRSRGVTVAEVDLHDSGALRAVFRTGRRAFLLNPPAPISGDTDVEERATIAAILDALDGSGLEKVVAESTYGAQPGDRIGDLSTLYTLEQGLAALPIPAAINRAAYYFSNFDMDLEPARAGAIPCMFPPDLKIPMAAPADLGRAAARRLTSPLTESGICYVEGPARYSFTDVAAAFAAALGRPVDLDLITRDRWVETFEGQGFSRAAADSYARMTAVSVDGGFAKPDDAIRGSTTLEVYIAGLVASAGGNSQG